jgi:heme/copper-type cytochrome/quinol oxidase subunit 1
MLAGAAVSCIFAAFYFYFGAIFGVAYSKFWATAHFVFYFFGQLFTVIPMFWLGYAGMPRRIMDYPAFFGGWHSVISGGHLLSVLSFVFFLINLIISYYEGNAPVSRTLGVSRLNNRLSFYAYERRKLAKIQNLAMLLDGIILKR